MSVMESYPTGPVTRVIDLSPQVAAQWLGSKSRNRNISSAAVSQYASDMANGRWILNGETIKLDREGHLIDGQHRCAAVVESGVTIPCLVVFGVDPAAMDTVDINRPRKAGDILAIHGVTRAPAMAAAAMSLIRYRRGDRLIWSGTNSPSKPEVIQLVEREQETLAECVAMTDSLRRIIPVTHAAYTPLLAEAMTLGYRDDVTDFHRAMLAGANLNVGDPRLVLRNFISSTTWKSKTGGWDTQRNLAICVKAFNAYIGGREIRLLRFTRDELPMPRIGA